MHQHSANTIHTSTHSLVPKYVHKNACITPFTHFHASYHAVSVQMFCKTQQRLARSVTLTTTRAREHCRLRHPEPVRRKSSRLCGTQQRSALETEEGVGGEDEKELVLPPKRPRKVYQLSHDEQTDLHHKNVYR